MKFEKFWENIDKIESKDIASYQEYFLEDCRSSTIFPVYKNGQTKTYIEFLTYWVRKHGNSVVMKLTARDLLGNTIRCHYQLILKYYAASIDISSFFDEKCLGFCGSVEIEVFSEKKPRYTFPAITLSIVNKKSSSVVHSCIRTYNKFEKINDYALGFPQTGFDVEIGLGKINYICFFGGNEKKYLLNIELSENGFLKKYPIIINNIKYGQSHFILIENLLSFDDAKLFERPRCSIEHNLKDIFPRFYVGIMEEGFCPTLTHTFFDTNQHFGHQNSESDAINSHECISYNTPLRAINVSPETHYDSSFIIPIYQVDEFKTSLMTYGQNLAFDGRVDLKILSSVGDVIFSRELIKSEIKSICSFNDFNVVDLLETCGLENNSRLSLQIGFIDVKIPFPVRFKFGLNVKRKTAARGANICFAPLVMQKTTLQKPFSRKWFPIGGEQKFIASIHNTTLLIEKNMKCSKIKLDFSNSKGYVMTRVCNIFLNSSIYIDPATDIELEKFLVGKVGWCMVTAENYLLDAYYFTMAGEQIGGDHAY